MSTEEIRVISENSDRKAVQEIIERERKKKAQEEIKASDTLEQNKNEVSEPMKNEVSEQNNEIKHTEKNSQKKNTKVFILAGVVLAAIIVAIVFFSSIYPGMQADDAFDEYISNYQAQLDKGDYDGVSNMASALIKEHKDYLDDSQKNTLEGIKSYSLGMKLLDYTSGVPSYADEYEAEECIKTAMEKCPDDLIPQDLCNELLNGINDYNDDYHGIDGSLTVDHSKFDAQEEETTDDSIEGMSFKLDDPVSFDTGNQDAQFTVVDGGSYKKKYNSGGSANIEWTKPGDSSEEDTETKPKEEKPVINEYSCSGSMNYGFRKKDNSKGLTKENIETIYIIDIYTLSTPEEEGVSSEYKAVFSSDQTDGIEVNGSEDTGVKGTATYKNGDFIVDFGKGVTLSVSTAEKETVSTGSSSQSSTPSTSSSSSSDYRPGSDWEKYDSDSDGKISDKEFQDATNDYMDDYFNEIGDGGNNLDAYDYNNDGEMATDEFQDAVGDYMDSHGY